MLGMGDSAVCAKCHENGKYGATLAGADSARMLRSDIDKLKNNIDTGEKTLNKAEQLGMEVSQPRFELRTAFDALTNARSLIHTFQLKPVETVLDGGEKISAEVQEKADHVLQEHTDRRIWLAATLVPILLVIALLLLYIRSTPVAE
jgi:hypothetical protein